MGAALVIGAGVALLLVFGGSRFQDEVVVLPSADGHVGAVVVQNAGGKTVLDTAYASSRSTSPDKAPEASKASEQVVRQEFAATLVALPSRPASFLLYFNTGTDELTDESKVELQKMLSELRRRSAPDIVVIGHTDTVGNNDDNDRLSLARAQRLKTEFAAQGIAPAERIRADGRGERELLVRTADGVDEPRNRRVEINVR